jgi:Response regulator containing a CheY-like receiver domain and an HTH DNA-binding domain
MIKVAMADDHMLVINGLQKIFSGEQDIVLTGTYTNGDLLLAGLQQQEPDVLLLDIQMPGKNGIELAGIINKKFPNIRIIALSNIEVLHQVKKMMKQGCSGYLLKDVDPPTLISAVHKVYEGQQVIHEKIRAELTGNLFGNDHAQVMTRREIEILQLIAEEYTNPQIAEMLHISPHTVENHRNHMLQKLGVKNTAGLIRKAMEQGLI